MVVNAADYGVDLDSGTTEAGTDDDSDDSDDSEYETYRRKHRAKAKAKKEKERKKKKKNSPATGLTKGRTLPTAGTAEEVTSLIRQLNKMSITDPEYPPVYYKVLSLDTTGIAAKCVQPPRLAPAWTEPNPKQNKGSDKKNASSEEKGGSPGFSTYPNSIPLGGNNTQRQDITGCYGCGTEGHRIGECPEIKDLLVKNIISVDEESRRLRMKDGGFIRRGMGETLVQAAKRIAAPRVMFSTREHTRARSPTTDESDSTRSAYIEAISDATSDDASENCVSTAEQRGLDAAWYVAQDSESEIGDGEVYLTVPRGSQIPNQTELDVNAAERTTPHSKTVRREIFDGVLLPRREKAATRAVPQAGENLDEKGLAKVKEAEKLQLPKARDFMPEITPADVRVPRSAMEDTEMADITPVRARPPKGKGEGSHIRDLQDENLKNSSRQSEIQSTVHIPTIIERILDLTVPMTVREIFVASKDIRTGIMDTIRLKNVKAVLLGRSQDNPLVAHWNWPRSEGVLIKIEVETSGRTITAIIDTGSQLDVVRADVAALKIQRPVDMTRVTNMNDANGGRGQLRGYVHDVEFSCGGVPTVTDLWVSQQAPFELLLGRPWQRGNLVSIDEREEGTYLVFKDAVTRQPRYELLAIPYERVVETARNGPEFSGTQGLAYTLDEPGLRSHVRAKTPLGNLRGRAKWEKGLELTTPGNASRLGLSHPWGRSLVKSFAASPRAPSAPSTISRRPPTLSVVSARLSAPSGLTTGLETTPAFALRPSCRPKPNSQGRAVTPNGQEIHHAILLNARMLMHDPTTGQPGIKSGHVIAHLYAAPGGNATWPMEIPVPTQGGLVAALPNYPQAVLDEMGKLRRDETYLMHLDRQVTPLVVNASDVANSDARALVLRPSLRSASFPAPAGRLVNPLVNEPGDTPYDPRLVPARGVGEQLPYPARLAVPRVFGNLFAPPPTLPPISQLGVPTCAYQTAAPPRLSLGEGQGGADRKAQAIRYLTHPPNTIPDMVTPPMQLLGMHTDGDHVWTVPTGPDAAAQYPSGRAPDTPRLPLRMLNDAPKLAHRTLESDADMPDATDDDADGSTDNEEIQTEARRMAADPSLSNGEAPKYVLNVLQLEGVESGSLGGQLTLDDLANAAAIQKEIEEARNDVQAFEADVEKVFLADKRSGEDQTGKEQGVKEKNSEHVLRDLPLLPRLDSPLTSISDSPPPLISDSERLSPLHIDDHDVSVESRSPSPVNQPPLRVATPFPDDCRSTKGGTGFFDNGIFGEGAITYSFPAVSDASSDEEDPVKLVEHFPYVPATAIPSEVHDKYSTVPNTWPVVKIEGAASLDFARRLNKEIRALPAKAARERAHNITWIKLRQHTIKYEHQRQRMRAEDIDGLLAPIRRAETIIKHSPNLVDITEMNMDYMVDLDMLEKLQAPDHTPAGKARLEAQARELDEILDVVAPVSVNGARHVIDSPGVPVSVDGKRYREFSDSSKQLSVAHRVGIKAQVLRRRGPITVYAVVRGCLLETIRLTEDFCRTHGWALDIVDLHQDAHECPPVLKDEEHGRLRLTMYAFSHYGYPEVANAINDLLGYRFYEPTIIRNLLEAGMLDANDTIYVDGGPPGGIKIEARDVAGYSKPKRPFPGRYPRNWTQQVLVPSPVPEAFEDEAWEDGRPQDEEEPNTVPFAAGAWFS
ncbi:hypothetical protein C8R47DRAFT_1224734 [Mycena vitilis]|nr:hypothetical protein C8R47DRAFT_1224734 [Mycena vitilis]